MKKLILILFTISILYAGFALADSMPVTGALGAPFASSWDTMQQTNNFTYWNATPKSINYTRGFIYEINMQVAQNTHRWVGYVGNISGNISLMDNNRNRLYGWELNITSGEIFATRFNGNSQVAESETALDNGSQRAGLAQGTADYDYVDWTNVRCARRDYIENESRRLGHNKSIDNDELNVTFQAVTLGMDFTVADRYIDVSDDLGAGVGCAGINLYENNANSSRWQEVILEDGTLDGVEGDIVFASIIEDDKVGFNGRTYDFQIMLPEYGAILNANTDDSVKDNIQYYFYLELIGAGWPDQPVR